MEIIEELLNHEALLQQQIADFKKIIDEERELRKKICLKLLAGKADGTHRFTYQNMMVKVAKSSTYSLDQKEIANMILDQEFSPEERDAIRTKYELDIAKYKRLDNSELLDNFITVKDAMPTLEIEFI